MVSSGHIVTELHPPVKTKLERNAKIRQIPHASGEIVRRVSAGTPLVATAATPDLLWLKVGDNEFIPTRDCNFAFSEERRSSPVYPVDPPMDAHVAGKSKVIVRKIPNDKGKAVGFLEPHDHIRIIGVTPDYTFAQIGAKQFVPITVLKIGDPLVTLSPPVTISIARRTPVYDFPSNEHLGVEGNVVSVLHEGDVVTASASTSDHEWLKIAPGSFIHTEATRMGLPHPPTTMFPKPLLVQVHASPCGVTKDPRSPSPPVLRELQKGDQLQAFGVTNDFKFLIVAHHRYIPILSVRLLSPLPEETPLSPPVPVELKADELLRHIPDGKGRVMMKGNKGDHYEATAVTEDFLWLKVGERQYVPLQSVVERKPLAPLRILSSPISVTLKEDVALRRRPDYNAKKRKVIAAGTVLRAIAATPDAEWLQLGGEKEFIPAPSAVLLPVPDVAPLTPPISAIILKDAKIYQSPALSSVVVKRVPRGEVVKVIATTTNLKWLKLDENKYLPTEFASHIPALVHLVPAVQFVVATPVKARNVPAFSGMGIHVVPKGEVVVATEATPDYKWVKIGEGRHLPTSALLLHESEGVDMFLVLKQRSGEAAMKAERGGKLTAKTLAPRRPQIEVSSTTPVAAMRINNAEHNYSTMSVGEFNHMNEEAPTDTPTDGVMQRTLVAGQPMKQIRVIVDAPVMNAPRKDATQVKTLREGTLTNVFAVDKNMKWLRVGPNEYIELDDTDVAKQVRAHQL
jgi:hypothetical protein